MEIFTFIFIFYGRIMLINNRDRKQIFRESQSFYLYKFWFKKNKKVKKENQINGY